MERIDQEIKTPTLRDINIKIGSKHIDLIKLFLRKILLIIICFFGISLFSGVYSEHHYKGSFIEDIPAESKFPEFPKFVLKTADYKTKTIFSMSELLSLSAFDDSAQSNSNSNSNSKYQFNVLPKPWVFYIELNNSDTKKYANFKSELEKLGFTMFFYNCKNSKQNAKDIVLTAQIGPYFNQDSSKLRKSIIEKAKDPVLQGWLGKMSIKSYNPSNCFFINI